jgi:hypothetical protein
MWDYNDFTSPMGRGRPAISRAGEGIFFFGKISPLTLALSPRERG